MLVVLEKKGKQNSWLVSQAGSRSSRSFLSRISKRPKSVSSRLEGETEAVADGDPDDLEDALAGDELDEQDAEETHLRGVF